MSRPRRRYLKRNAGTEGPTSLLFFDTESISTPDRSNPNRRELSLRLWCASYVRREGTIWREPVQHTGTTAESFWECLERYSDWKKPLWVFAHNLGHDLTQTDFWTTLECFRWTAGPVQRPPSPKTGRERAPWRGRLCLEGRPTFLVLRGRHGTVRMVDSGNYWPTSLAKIGDRHELPKLPMPPEKATASAWTNYCRRDVDVVRVAICDLIDRWVELDCGVFKMTAPSLAMTNYQHTSNCRTPDGQAVNIVLEDDSPARACERGSYMGGRIEPFFIGKMAGPIHYLDCNSLYLHLMETQLFPRRRVRQMRNLKPNQLLRLMASCGAVADVQINTGTDLASYPVKHQRMQSHCCGQFWTTLCGPELLRALQNGHVQAVAECHIYSLARLFSGWAQTWLDRRREAKMNEDAGAEEFAKLIGNSLGGKFGQRGDWWIDDKTLGRRKGWSRGFETWPETGEWSELRWVAGHGQRRVRGKEAETAFPIISSYLTGYGREYMRQAFAAIGDRSLLYSATDSIVCTQPGYDRLQRGGWIDPDEPGKFRLEDTYPDCEVFGPNWYRLGDHWTVSGWHGRAMYTPDGEGFVEVWDHLGHMMHANPKGRSGIEIIPLSGITPTMKNDAQGDGWRRPYRLSQDEDFTDHLPRLRDSRAVPEPV